MAITRRQFIARTGMFAAGTFLGSGLFRNPLLRKAMAEVIGDRYFIVLFLDGGNDGLNTIVPYDNGLGSLRIDYESARGTGPGGLRLSPGALWVPASGPSMLDPNTGAQLGFHPGLAGINALYEQGKVAVVQGCGYPDFDLSHEVSSSIWETGDPLGGLAGSNGWMGRYLLAAAYASTEIPAVCIRPSVAREYAQNGTSVLAIQRLRNFGFPFDLDYEDDEIFKRDAFDALYGNATGSSLPILGLLGSTGTATLLSADAYPPLHETYRNDRPSWDEMYTTLGSSTANDLREIAKIIYGVANGAPNVEARFFELRNGGYDTHSNQGGAETDGQHYGLHNEVGSAIQLFFDDLADMQPGLENKVTMMVWSEFARRIPQNDNGTDHGSQGPMFVIGGSVNGGVYGNHPNINDAALDDDGNTVYSQAGSFRSTDIRDVYGSIMKGGLQLPNPAPLFPLDAGDPADYWTVANFDMPLFV
jgi:uncharacterized protein (DUF1501 family)